MGISRIISKKELLAKFADWQVAVDKITNDDPTLRASSAELRATLPTTQNDIPLISKHHPFL